MPSGDPSVPSPGPSRLLALPRELRDIIYDYVLSEENDLLLVRDDIFHHVRPSYEYITTFPRLPAHDLKGCRNSDLHVESNQLKYVNHQLYHETKGLGLKLNDLTIHSHDQVYEFSEFIRKCSATQLQKLRKVTLTLSHNKSYRQMMEQISSPSELTKWCISNPECEMNIQLNLFDWGNGKTWHRLGKNIISQLRRLKRHDKSAYGPSLFLRQQERKVIPNNMRLYPLASTQHPQHAPFSMFARECFGEQEVERMMADITTWLRKGFPILEEE